MWTDGTCGLGTVDESGWRAGRAEADGGREGGG